MTFAFTARSKTGEKMSGTIEAEGRTDAMQKMERMGLIPVSLIEQDLPPSIFTNEQTKTAGIAVVALVLGILSFVFLYSLNVFLSIPAIIAGHIGKVQIRKKPEYYKGARLALVGLVLGYINLAISLPAFFPAFKQATRNIHEQPAPKSQNYTATRITIDVPKQQTDFTYLVTDFAGKYNREPNAIRKTELRITKRKAAFMSFFGNDLSVYDWVGKLEQLTTLEDGSASVRLRLANNVALQTQDSIFGKGTRLTPNSPCYSVLANASIGDWLIFSGVFVPGEQDHLRIPGLASEATTMQSPTFEFSFTKMSPYIFRIYGVGVIISLVDSEFVIERVLSDSPAAKVGISKGDVIKSINGLSTSGKSLEYVVNILRGNDEGPVQVRILRNSDNMSFDIKRELINIAEY